MKNFKTAGGCGGARPESRRAEVDHSSHRANFGRGRKLKIERGRQSGDAATSGATFHEASKTIWTASLDHHHQPRAIHREGGRITSDDPKQVASLQQSVELLWLGDRVDPQICRKLA